MFTPPCRELLIGRVAHSLRKLPGAAGGFSLHHHLQQMEKFFAAQGSFFGNCLSLNVCAAIVNELVHTRARLIAEMSEYFLALVPTCLRSRPR